MYAPLLPGVDVTLKRRLSQVMNLLDIFSATVWSGVQVYFLSYENAEKKE